MGSDRKKKRTRKTQYPPHSINPPVITRSQSLPFDKLAWEDFENLCLCLVEQTQNIEEARRYGEHGDYQEGIDIYAKLKSEASYITYQCKREKDFGPAKIKAAVSTFMEGSWFEKSQKFVICTQESLGSKKRADEIEKQRARLQSLGNYIELEVWDSNRLSRKLKDHPKIVEDFFDTAWAEAFCGKTSTLAVTDEQSGDAIQEYKSWLVTTTSYFEIPTIHQRFSISEDWIPREIACDGKEKVHLNVEVAAEMHRRLFLRGDSGSGKSTIMKRLCNSFTVIGKVVLYVYLPEVLRLYKSGKNFEDAILSAATDGLNSDKDVLSSLLTRSDYLLADGLDECQRGSAEIAKKLNVWAEGHSETRVVVTCRNGTVPESFFDWQNAEIQALNGRDITNLSKIIIEKLINDQEQRDNAERIVEDILKDKEVFSLLERSPLFVGFFIRLISTGEEFDYKNKTEVYKASIALAYDHLPQRARPVEMDRRSAMKVLEISGQKLFKMPETTAHQLIDHITDVLKSDGFTLNQAEDTAEQGIRFWKEQRVLTQYCVGYESAVRFVHSSLCEYGAGQYANHLDEDELGQWIDDVLSLGVSSQEAIFFASGLGAGEQIIRHLIANSPYSCNTSEMPLLLASKVISSSNDISEELLKTVVLRIIQNLDSSDPDVVFECVSMLLRILPKGSGMIYEIAKPYLGSNQHWSNVGAIIIASECNVEKLDDSFLINTLGGLVSKELLLSEQSTPKASSNIKGISNRFAGFANNNAGFVNNNSVNFYLSSQAVLSVCRHLLKYYINDIEVISKVVEFLLNKSFTSNELTSLRYRAQIKIAENCTSSGKSREWLTLLLKLRSQESLFPDFEEIRSKNLKMFQDSIKIRHSDRAFLRGLVRIVESNKDIDSTKEDSFLHMVVLGQLLHGMKVVSMLEKDWRNICKGGDIEAFDVVLRSMIALLGVSPNRLLSEATTALKSVERLFSYDLQSISKSFEADPQIWLSQLDEKAYKDIVFSTSLYGQVPKLPETQVAWENAKSLGLSPQILVRALEHPSLCISWNAALLIKHGAGGDEAIRLTKSLVGTDEWEAFKNNKSEEPY